MTSTHDAARVACARLHALAREHGVALDPERVRMRMDGSMTVDGVPARVWVERELGVTEW